MPFKPFQKKGASAKHPIGGGGGSDAESPAEDFAEGGPSGEIAEKFGKKPPFGGKKAKHKGGKQASALRQKDEANY